MKPEELPQNPVGPVNMKGKEFGDFTPDNDPLLAERKAKAIQLRAAGFSFRAIGKALGVSHVQAWRIVTSEIKEARTATREQAEDLRHVAHVRLESMINRVWLKAMPNDPNAPLDLLAMDRLIRIMVFHARLMGYEEPQRFQVDINEVRVQFGVIIEKIAKVIPEDSAPRVMEVLDVCLKEMEHKQLQAKEIGEKKDQSRYRDVIEAVATRGINGG